MKAFFRTVSVSFLAIALLSALALAWHILSFMTVVEIEEASRHLLGATLTAAMWILSMVGFYIAEQRVQA